jgi:hypothetical protein
MPNAPGCQEKFSTRKEMARATARAIQSFRRASQTMSFRRALVARRNLSRWAGEISHFVRNDNYRPCHFDERLLRGEIFHDGPERFLTLFEMTASMPCHCEERSVQRRNLDMIFGDCFASLAMTSGGTCHCEERMSHVISTDVSNNVISTRACCEEKSLAIR